MLAQRVILLLIIGCVLNVHTVVAGVMDKTLRDFGVRVQHGQPVYPLASNVALGLFNPDPLLDLAYYSDNKIQVWQNLGNGTFGNAPVWERTESKVVEKMEFRKTRMLSEMIFDHNSWGDLVLTFADGRTESTSHETMLNSSRSFASLPQSITSFPPLNFREVWKSPLNNEPGPEIAIDDIDNDGKVEIAYWFYPPLFDSTNRFVVYEVVGNDSLRVEWDTIMYGGGGYSGVSDIDNNGRKEWIIGRYGASFLESHGSGHYRLYTSNVYPVIPGEVYQIKAADIDNDGKDEIVMLNTDSNRPIDPTFFIIGKFVMKVMGGPSGWMMVFNQELARYQSYCFDMAIGQMDGVGKNEIVPGNGGFGVGEPTPIHYLWYSGLPSPLTWIKRNIYTGLQSGSSVPMFVNIDTDTTKELVIGGVGPLGHGSFFALDYLRDSTWSVLWADSTLRNSPLTATICSFKNSNVAVASNTWHREQLDTLYSILHMYSFSGSKTGEWVNNRNTMRSIQLLDIDVDGKTNLICAQLSQFLGHKAAVYEYEEPQNIGGNDQHPKKYELNQNYPNPFNPSTTIKFQVPQAAVVHLKVFDMLGKETKTLINKQMEQGIHTLMWNGTTNEGGDASSGVYFYRLTIIGETGALYTDTKKMILIR